MIFYTHLPVGECMSRLQDPEGSGSHGASVVNDPKYCRQTGKQRIVASVAGCDVQVDLLGATKNYSVASFCGTLSQEGPDGGTTLQGRFSVSASTVVAVIMLVLLAAFSFLISALAPQPSGQPARDAQPGTYMMWYVFLVPMAAMMVYQLRFGRSLLRSYLTELLEASDITSTHRSNS